MNDKKNIILGISGTIGAGKGTAVSYLIKKYGFTHFSARNFLLEQIRKEGLPSTRDVMYSVANKLRLQHSPSYIIECLYTQAKERGGYAVIESVRTIGEANFLKEHSARILAIDADHKVRYRRIKQRGLSTDHVSFEEFSAQEEAEMNNTDPNKQNISGVIKMADFLIDNNFSYKDFSNKLEKVYTSLIA